MKIVVNGYSGSGKSTVSRLAARFWDADAGQVLLGGVDVTTVEPETLFKNYAIVFQDVVLFRDTVMENIRYGKLDATDEEVYAAAKLANADDFIRLLPNGYDTVITGNGGSLSQWFHCVICPDTGNKRIIRRKPEAPAQ